MQTIQEIIAASAADLRRATLALIAENNLDVAKASLSILASLDHLSRHPTIATGLTAEEQRLALEVHPDGTSSKIVAIKAYRNRTGRGLKDAKDAVEAFLRTQGRM